ncbi:MAG TPA: phosphonate C-P lyase system protein PhnG [Gammaproteobacteria bacterium]|nr:phosphonate C-P lyase system protein PhnG [Gammaproteobacteria bacterium]
MTEMKIMMIDRTLWVSALKALPIEQLLSFTTELSKDWAIRSKSIPQSGLGMLRLNDSAFEEAFYLGEFPLASAWLEIETSDGLIAEGAAQVMDDRIEAAEALALCDAVLSAQLPGWEQLNKMLDQGMEIRESASQNRKHMLASTKVDFSLLDEVAPDAMEGKNAES